MFNYHLFDAEKLEYVALGPIEDLPPGHRLFVEIDTKPIVVVNLAGELFAIADLCSHDDGPLGDGAIEGYDIICPRHGARFDIRTGEVLLLPAPVDVPAYPVKVEDGKILIGVPLEE